MMRRTGALIALMIVVTAQIAAATPVTIDFETLPGSPYNFFFQDVGTHFEQNGYDLDALSTSFRMFGSLQPTWMGSAAIFNNSNTGTTQLVAADGGAFDLLSIDLGRALTFESPPSGVTFIGTISSGGTVSQSFNLSSVLGPQHFTFQGFQDLTRVTWNEINLELYQWDNIVVEAKTPEPSSILLLLVGAGALVFRRRM
jgi:hypothetical protein